MKAQNTAAVVPENANVGFAARTARLFKKFSMVVYFMILITPIVLFLALLPILMLVSLFTG